MLSHAILSSTHPFVTGTTLIAATAPLMNGANIKCFPGAPTNIFFTPLDPFNSDANEADSITDIEKPRRVQYQIHWRLEQDAVYRIHLSTAQDAGLQFWQSSCNAVITHQSVPKERVVKGCQRKWKERIVRKTAHTSRTTKSNSQTIMDS